ncbi:DUF1616 domain-containing protein [Halorussus pelagicus]|uniref:DUF1616 domain-containing protein n=1 Tax=Halorussus pelagicus TaxID=2505977 RepID=UPI000FFCB8EF|nr:DUF1616 domain-containing protein [Halorussus pelagicus]
MSGRPHLPRRVGRLPADLAAVAALDALAVLALFVPAVRATPVRAVLGLPFLLVLPGYALVSALFPENQVALSAGQFGRSEQSEGTPSDDPEEDAQSDPGVFLRHELDGVERLGLSVGASIVVVAAVALALDRSAGGLGTSSLVASVGAFTLGHALVAVRRREQLPEGERFAGTLGASVTAARAELFGPETKVDAALNVLVVVSLVLAAGGTAYAVTTESGDAGDTELYLLAENDDGALVADNYPDTLSEARRNPLVVGVENGEGDPAEYTVVAQLQRVTGPPSATTVVAERELARYGVRVVPGESWETRHVPRARMRGDRLRLAYLLYRGEPPADPSVENAEREVHLWLNGTQGGAEASGQAGTTAPETDAPQTLGRWS